MNLAETQRLFWELLQGYDRPLHGFVGSAELPASERVGIYTRMFIDRQVDALRETFPKTVAAVGDPAFYELASQYLRAHPSTHPDLGQVGHSFAAFLQRADLADLARLEWARAEVFEAAPAQSLTAADFAALARDPVEFAHRRVHAIPAVRLLDLDYDIDPLWDGGAKAAMPQRSHVVVWRAGFEVFHAAVDGSEAAALRLAIEGAPLGDICGALADPARAVEVLQSWLDEGFISSTAAKPEPG